MWGTTLSRVEPHYLSAHPLARWVQTLRRTPVHVPTPPPRGVSRQRRGIPPAANGALAFGQGASIRLAFLITGRRRGPSHGCEGHVRSLWVDPFSRAGAGMSLSRSMAGRRPVGLLKVAARAVLRPTGEKRRSCLLGMTRRKRRELELGSRSRIGRQVVLPESGRMRQCRRPPSGKRCIVSWTLHGGTCGGHSG